MMKDLPRPDGDRGQAGAVRLVRGGHVHLGDAGTRLADPGRVGGVHARARHLHTPVPLRLRERVAPRLRAGRHQHVAILIGALLFMALFAGADWLIRKASRC